MIYFDHAATTRPLPAVVDHLCQHAERDFFNPAAAYRPAIAAEKEIARSLGEIGATMGAEATELIVTSGATESINTVFKGYCPLKKRQGRCIVICEGDHPATLESATYMESLGWSVSRIPLAASGEPDLSALGGVLQEKAGETCLVSLPAVNNELGSITPLREVRAMMDKLAPKAALHVDCVQAWNRLPLDLHSAGIDFASFSGHKIGGPKRIGLLYARRGIRFEPLLHGGGQQKGRRSGTEAVAPISALAIAARFGQQNRAADYDHASDLRSYFLQELRGLGLTFLVNAEKTAIPHILNISFPGLRGETLLHILEEQEIYVSTGSACSTGKKTISHVLRALKIPQEAALGTIRISFGRENTKAELENLIKVLGPAVTSLLAIKR